LFDQLVFATCRVAVAHRYRPAPALAWPWRVSQKAACGQVHLLQCSNFLCKTGS
jgi:hypothetical protein